MKRKVILHYMKRININVKDQGFIQLNRALMDSIVFANANLLRLYLWCYFKATYKPKSIALKVGTGRTEVHLNKGEFVTGRKSAAEQLDVKESTLWSWLKKLEKYGFIEIKSNRNYSIINVIDFKKNHKRMTTN